MLVAGVVRRVGGSGCFVRVAVLEFWLCLLLIVGRFLLCVLILYCLISLYYFFGDLFIRKKWHVCHMGFGDGLSIGSRVAGGNRMTWLVLEDRRSKR